MKSFSLLAIALVAFQASCVMSEIVTKIDDPSQITSKQQLCNIISHQHSQSRETCMKTVHNLCYGTVALFAVCQAELPQRICRGHAPDGAGIRGVKANDSDWKKAREQSPEVDVDFAEECDDFMEAESSENLEALVEYKVNTKEFCKDLIGDLDCLTVTTKGLRGICKFAARQVHC